MQEVDKTPEQNRYDGNFTMIEIRQHSNCGKNKRFDTGSDFYYSPIVEGKEYSHIIAETEDMAMLIGLGIKYDGLNSQFPRMAARMLGIKTKWA
jgi:hypothetical protein